MSTFVSRGTSPYTSGGAGALVPEEVSYDLMQSIQAESIALNLFPIIEMGVQTERLPVPSALASAYFIGGDSGAAQTTTADWKNKYISTGKIGAIVAVPNSLLGDSAVDMFAYIKPQLVGAISRLFDQAVFLNAVVAGAPSDWPSPIAVGAASASQTVNRATASQANGGLSEDINQAMDKVLKSGFRSNCFVLDTTYETFLRQVRDTTGQPIQQLLDAPNMAEGQTPENYSFGKIYGRPAYYGMEGLWPATGTRDVELIVGDRRQVVLGRRQDISWKVLKEATIPDATGALINLATQDMVAIMVTCRLGWQMANIVNYRKTGDDTTRYPFATILSNP